MTDAPAPIAARFDAILFDCDGTLVDSEVPGMDVLHEQALLLGLTLTREAAHAAFRGQRMADCIGFIVQRLPQGHAPDLEAFTDQVRQQQALRFRASLQAMPGAHALLARLTQPFCIATNGPRAKAELTLGLTGLLPHFTDAHGDRLFCAYDVGHFKPEPGLFLHAAQALGAAPQRCAVVEDSLPGIRAGLAAGMQVFAMCPPALLAELALPATAAAQVQLISGLDELDWLLHG